MLRVVLRRALTALAGTLLAAAVGSGFLVSSMHWFTGSFTNVP
jgi:hypothetical protein